MRYIRNKCIRALPTCPIAMNRDLFLIKVNNLRSGTRCVFSCYQNNAEWDKMPFNRWHRSTRSAKAKHLYNICTTSAQRLRRWTSIVQMLYKSSVFAGRCPIHDCHKTCGYFHTAYVEQIGSFGHQSTRLRVGLPRGGSTARSLSPNRMQSVYLMLGQRRTTLDQH